MRKTSRTAISCVLALTFCITGAWHVLASPSITSLHDTKETTVIEPVSTDGTNTGEILAATGIYTNEAVSDQYKHTDEQGELAATPLSEMIDTGAGTITETDQNGNAIPDEISTVEDMLDTYCAAAKVDKTGEEHTDIDLSQLDQLTYWLDFKYKTTDYRVIAGENVTKDGKATVLDDGMVVAAIDGGEIIRAANMEDYLIIQIDATTGKLHYLTMKDYDVTTGRYTVEFPCVGPYMVTQVMK